MCVENMLMVSVESSPAFTSRPAHITVVEGEPGPEQRRESYDVPREGWREAGDLLTIAIDAQLSQHQEMFAVRLAVRDTPAHEC